MGNTDGTPTEQPQVNAASGNSQPQTQPAPSAPEQPVVPPPPTVPPPPEDPPVPLSQPAQTPTVPKSQFDGLRGWATNVSNENTQLRQLLDTARQAYEGLTGEFTSTKAALEQRIQTLDSTVQQEKSRADAAEAKASLLELIITQYPILVEPYSKGLINTRGLEGEALTQYLDGLKAEREASAAVRSRDFALGSLPSTPPPAGTPTGSLVELQKQMDLLLRTKGINSPEYQEARLAYLEALKPR